jgi:hypothetical protein
MEYIWILPIALIIILEIAAIAVVSNEDILYTFEDRTKKITFIIFVPIVGAIIELRKLDKYARYKKDTDGNEVMVYAFWAYYTTSQSSVDNVESHNGFDGGGSSD